MLKVKAMLCLVLLMFTTSAYCRDLRVRGAGSTIISLGTITDPDEVMITLSKFYYRDSSDPNAHQPRYTINNCSPWDAFVDGKPHLRFSLRDHPAGKAMLTAIRYSIANKKFFILSTTENCLVDKTMEDVDSILIE
ncbi:MAG: hypothetical protein HY273_07255 [Gammaproteobacteria bacterium]|nr:hypothetical protein [Gammaproteobacteria bacterium]